MFGEVLPHRMLEEEPFVGLGFIVVTEILLAKLALRSHGHLMSQDPLVFPESAKVSTEL